MKFEHKSHLNTRNKFIKEIFFPNPKIGLEVEDEKNGNAKLG
jgi:hypothetical protein